MSTATVERGTGRVLAGLCLVMGPSLIVAPSFNYLLTPLLADLGLTQDEASTALALPWIASLLVVFIAGRLGDRLGHRRVIIWLCAPFILGSLLVTITQGLPLLALGLLLEGMAATAIQIVVLGLLSDQFPEPAARAKAFGTFGMVSPFIWMLFPVLTGAIVREHSWRLVTILWVIGGVVMVLAARALLPPAASVRPVGEVRTPLLAGLTVVLVVQGISRIPDLGIMAPASLLTLGAAVASGMACSLLMRRSRESSFSITPLRDRRARLLLGVVIIIPLINTVFLMTLAFQYLYGMSVLQTALLMVPAQAAAVIGTRTIAGPLMRRIGVTRTAAGLFGVLAVGMLCSFAMTPSSPLWIPATYVAVYNVLTVAASITVTSGLLATATADNSGLVSAYRGSGMALGGMLAVVVMNALVFGLAQLGMFRELQGDGLSAADASSLMEQVQAQSTSTSVMTTYASTSLPSGASVSDVLRDVIASGLHVNGVLGSLLSITCVVLVLRSARAGRSMPSSAG